MTKRPMDALCDFLGITDMSVSAITVIVDNPAAGFRIITTHRKYNKPGEVEVTKQEWKAIPIEDESSGPS